MTKQPKRPPVERVKTCPKGVKLVLDPALVKKYASQGMTLKQIAESLGVSDRTLKSRKAEDEELQNAWLEGRAKGIQVVVNALFKKAKEGNVVAQIFYLKNMAGWQDKVTVDDDRTLPAPLIIHVNAKGPVVKDVTPKPGHLGDKS